MKAAQISQYGDASVVKINEADKPTAGENQVLIEVHASSINPFDAKLRAGYMKDGIPLEFPFTLGGDVSGDIVEVGAGVDNFAVGDKVYGQAAGVAGNSGAFAGFALTVATHVGKQPANVDYKQAASLPLVGVSALQALKENLNLQSGQKIFIHGGAGGIGTVAIQIAKNIGAYVATTATGENIDAVKQLGADEVVDYKSQNFVEALRDYDAVFDTVGGEDFEKSLIVLKRGGIAVSMAGQADEGKANELGVDAITQATKVNTERLDELKQLVEAGVVRPQVDKVFPLDQIQDAFYALESGSVKGKVVIEVK